MEVDPRVSYELAVFEEAEVDDGIERLAVVFTPTGFTAVHSRITNPDAASPTVVVSLALNTADADIAAHIVVAVAKRLRDEMPLADITVDAPGVIDGPDGPTVWPPTRPSYPGGGSTSEVEMGGGTGGFGMGDSIEDMGAGFEIGTSDEKAIDGGVERFGVFGSTSGGTTALTTRITGIDTDRPKVEIRIALNTDGDELGAIWMVSQALQTRREFPTADVIVQPVSRTQTEILENNGWTPVRPDGLFGRILASRSTPEMRMPPA